MIRLEFNKNTTISTLNKEFFYVLKIFSDTIYFIIFSLNKKIFINLFFFYLVSNYRGNRHLLSLPVNGQRT